MIKLKSLLTENPNPKQFTAYHGTGSLPTRSEFRERKFSYGNKRIPFGPHSGDELALMLSGKKPAALMSETDINFEMFLPYISNGTFYSENTVRNDGIRVYFIALPSEKWRARKMKKLFEWKEKIKAEHGDNISLGDVVDVKTLIAFHIKLGVLLGYSKGNIQSFLKKLNLKGL